MTNKQETTEEVPTQEEMESASRKLVDYIKEYAKKKGLDPYTGLPIDEEV